jgi:hypothetical protein
VVEVLEESGIAKPETVQERPYDLGIWPRNPFSLVREKVAGGRMRGDARDIILTNPAGRRLRARTAPRPIVT